MKCWDSITSLIAASTSALIVRYCALRSSNGTCIIVLPPFQLPVRRESLAQFRRQWCFFIQIETTQNAWRAFLITIAALGTDHYPIGVGQLEPVPMTAHPSCLAAWVSDDQRKIRHVLGNHRTCADECVASDCD